MAVEMTDHAKPIVFVSSTIKDFADLRSSLRYWLEEFGFDVQMSEFNDFDRAPELNAFDECFESLKRSDYYLLLIGERRGALYDEKQRISVTQQEYRTAYKSMNERGKPVVVSFLREKVQTVLRERAELKRSGVEVPNDVSSVLDDADFTASFLREVRREDELQQAVEAGTDPPAGNWVTPFASFRELIEGVRAALHVQGPLARAASVESVRHELEQNLRLALHKTTKGRPFYTHMWIDKLRDEVNIGKDELRCVKALSREQVSNIATYLLVGATTPDAVMLDAVNAAITSGVLLDYDIKAKAFVPSELLRNLHRLREEVAVYSKRFSYVLEKRWTWEELWQHMRDTHLDSTQVKTLDLVPVLGLHDSQRNVLRLTLGALRHIYGHTTSIEVMLRPGSPIEGMDEELRGEKVSEEELAEWLRSDSAYLRMGTVDRTADVAAQMAAVADLVRMLNTDAGPEVVKKLLEAAKKQTSEKRAQFLGESAEMRELAGEMSPAEAEQIMQDAIDEAYKAIERSLEPPASSSADSDQTPDQ